MKTLLLGSKNIPRSACCGCGACVAICQCGALTMQASSDGFLYPQVNAEKCVHCGVCASVCSVLNPAEPRRPLHVLAAKNRDENVRMHSSSGGVFFSLARKTISEGGVVFGACFDLNWNVVHRGVTDVNELPLLMGSKYVQSEVGNSYRHVKECLKKGQRVLFIGTPCQVTGLRRVIGRTEDNLLLIDLVCHAAPSPVAWQAYLRQRMIEAGVVSEGAPGIRKISFRDKRLGWKNFSVVIEFKNGKTYQSSFGVDPYMRSFLSELSCRPSCAACSCRSFRSGSDITIGDYWGIDTCHPEFDDDKGASLVLINSERGFQEWRAVSGEFVSEVSSYDDALKGNPALEHSKDANCGQRQFFELQKYISFDRSEAIGEHMAISDIRPTASEAPGRVVGICTFHSSLNYGGVLQCHALLTALKRMLPANYEVKVINIWLDETNYNFTHGEDVGSLSEDLQQSSESAPKRALRQRIARTHKFLSEKLAVSEPHFCQWNELSEADYAALGLDVVVVGSDQVWHCGDWGDPKPFLLCGAPGTFRAISYAASFGLANLGGNEQLFRLRLSRFDALSCREASGCKLCEELGYSASHVVDPTLLVELDDWTHALGIHAGRRKNTLVCYFLSEDVEAALPILSSFAVQTRCQVLVYVDSWKEFETIPAFPNVQFCLHHGPVEFLEQISRARWVLSDSFHALMFSIRWKINARIIRPSSQVRMTMFSRIEEFSRYVKGPFLVESVAAACASFSADETVSYDWESLDKWRRASRQFLYDGVMNGPETKNWPSARRN